MSAGTRFDWHTHEDHQLAWAASGVLTVLTADATWVLPPTRALWIPAGLRHETASDGGHATMRSLYIRPGLFQVSWGETASPTPVRASPLLAELIGYLGQPDLDPGHRMHAEVELVVPSELTLVDAHATAHQVEHLLLHAIPRLTGAVVHVSPPRSAAHDAIEHHRTHDEPAHPRH